MPRILLLPLVVIVIAAFTLSGASPSAAQGTGSDLEAEYQDPSDTSATPGHGGASISNDSRDAPFDVAVGIEIDQIVGVDQKAENYSAVAIIRLKWHDPALAYEDTTGRGFRLFKSSDLIDYANTVSTLIPFIVVHNQQSRRIVHQNMNVVMPDGTAFYFEKSSLTLQAPHFNFTQFPFDRQKFYFEVMSGLPSELVRFHAMTEQSGLGDMLGEEEWILENAVMEISTAEGLTGLPSARAALAFEGHRHLKYYVIRIFVPLLVLITVSWSVFFLDDYRKRSEIAGANLLVFVGFNWVISDSLPRLGYLTFMDFILQWIFVFTGAIVVFNVVLSRLQATGHAEFAQTMDNYLIKWIYPLGYIGVVTVAAYMFLSKL
jgi:hypothetical protein